MTSASPSPASSEPDRRARRALFRALTISAAILAVFLIAELGLSPPSEKRTLPPRRYFYASDEVLGYRLNPGWSGTIRLKVHESTASINSIGLRGPEPRLDPAAIRILCLGDSFTFGLGVDDDEAYPAVLQNLLGERFEVFNVGVPGHGNDESRVMLERLAPTLSPDLVIAAFFPANDFIDNRRPAVEYRRVVDGYLVGRPTSTIDRSFVMLPVLWLSDRLYVVGAAHGALARILDRSAWWADRAGTGNFEPEDFTNTVSILTDLVHDIEKTGAEPLLFFVPPRVDILSQPAPPIAASSVLETVSRRTGAAWVDPTGDLMVGGGAQNYLEFDGHWSAEGHQVAALRLAEAIRSLALERNDHVP